MVSLTYNQPTDFVSYWNATLDELSETPLAQESTEIPLRSTDFCKTYTIHLTSLGPYRIFGYLSIPAGEGPFPARYYLPKYGSVVEPIPQGSANSQRQDYVTFSLGARGQRGSDQPFAASFPGLLTEGIDDPLGYVFRGIIADCCRGLEYLLSRPEVDTGRVVGIGNDLALITASLKKGLTHIVTTPALFYATSDLSGRTNAYPLEEINDYTRRYPSKMQEVTTTLSYMDLRWFSPPEESLTLMIGGSKDDLLNQEILQPLLHKFNGKLEFHPTEHSAYRDGLFAERWIAGQMGMEHPALPENWR